MPPKIRQLIQELETAGYTNRGGKGSHRNYVHTRVGESITISCKLGSDARQYLIKAVRRAIEEAEQ